VPDPTEEFFERLSRRGYEPRLVRFGGTIRFELGRDQPAESWTLRIDQGSIRVAREDGPADLTIKADRAAFNRILGPGGDGRDIMAAYVRQAIMVEGSPRMLYVLRILGGSPEGSHPESLSTRRSGNGS
jgi:hypothetical protein